MYNKAISMVQEVMRDYYIRGERIQYNYSRSNYGSNSPEEATSQDMKYLVCAAYTYSTYVEAFGVTYSGTDNPFPPYNYSITGEAMDYYMTNKDDASKMDGHLLIYFEKKDAVAANSIKYLYNSNASYTEEQKASISNFAQQIKPGDLFTYGNLEKKRACHDCLSSCR